MSLLRLAYLNIVRRWASAFFVVISLALAVATTSIILKLHHLSEQRFAGLALEGDALVGAKSGGIDILLGALNLEGGAEDYVPFRLYESLASQENIMFEDGAMTSSGGVRQAVPFLHHARWRGHRVIGTNSKFLERVEPADRIALKEGEWAESAGEVVLGSSLAHRYGLTLGDEISARLVERSRLGVYPERSLQVVGILAPTKKVWDFALYTSLPEAMEHLGLGELGEKSIWGTQVLHYFLFYLSSDADFRAMRSLINQRSVGQMVSVEEEYQRLLQLTGTGQKLGIFMALMILCLAATAITGVMVLRYDSLASQLAVLRALGYRRSELTRALSIEGLLMGAMGGLIGLALDFFSFPFLRSLLELSPSALTPDPHWISWLVFALACGLIVVAVLIPLWKVYGRSAHEGLQAPL